MIADGRTLLMVCIGRRFYVTFRHLLNNYSTGCLIDHQDADGRTALMYAILHNHRPMAMRLLDKGCNIILKDRDNTTALSLAIRWRLIPIAERILSDPDCRRIIGVPDNYGCTALIYACYGEIDQIAHAIVNLYPDECELNHQDDCGDTFLMIACRKGMNDLVKKIVKDDKYNIDTSLKNNNGEYLITLVDKHMPGVIKYLLKRDTLTKLFGLEPHVQKVMNKYLEKYMSIGAERLVSSKDLEKRRDRLKEIKSEMSKMYRQNECFTCCEETTDSIIYDRCNHVFTVCKKCQNVIDKKCPICRRHHVSFEKAYVV